MQHVHEKDEPVEDQPGSLKSRLGAGQQFRALGAPEAHLKVRVRAPRVVEIRMHDGMLEDPWLAGLPCDEWRAVFNAVCRGECEVLNWNGQPLLEPIFSPPGPNASRKVIDVYKRDRWLCRYCGFYSDVLTIDHVTPRARGGDDSVENTVVACWHCNSQKGSRTPDEAGMTLLPAPGGE